MAYFRGVLIKAIVIITCISATSVSNAQSVTLRFSTPQRLFTVSAYQLPGAASRPAVLIMSGAKGYKAAEYSRLVASLNSSGIDALLIDYLSDADFAATENADSASARITYYSQRMAEWSATIRCVLSEVRKQPRYQSKIGLLGISLGAMPTTTVGVNNPNVAAMALVDGGFPANFPTHIDSVPPLILVWEARIMSFRRARQRFSATSRVDLGAQLNFSSTTAKDTLFFFMMAMPAPPMPTPRS
jgi:dienelactone hydrolase